MNPRRKFKMKMCGVCGRDHKVYPVNAKGGGISYRGTCPYCGSRDFSTGKRFGHLEITQHEHKDEEDEDVYDLEFRITKLED